MFDVVNTCATGSVSGLGFTYSRHWQSRFHTAVSSPLGESRHSLGLFNVSPGRRRASLAVRKWQPPLRQGGGNIYWQLSGRSGNREISATCSPAPGERVRAPVKNTGESLWALHSRELKGPAGSRTAEIVDFRYRREVANNSGHTHGKLPRATAFAPSLRSIE